MRAIFYSFIVGAALLHFANAEDSKPQSSPPPKTAKDSMEMRKKFAELSAKVNEQPEIKKLKASAEEAQKAYMTAFEAAMTKEDAEIMAKYKEARDAAMERMRSPGPMTDKAKTSSGYDQLKDEEKKQLFDLRKQAMESPSVKDARQKRNSAKSEQERKSAEEEYKKALRSAMLEIDEKAVKLLDKLEGKSEAKAEPAATPAKKN